MGMGCVGMRRHAAGSVVEFVGVFDGHRVAGDADERGHSCAVGLVSVTFAAAFADRRFVVVHTGTIPP